MLTANSSFRSVRTVAPESCYFNEHVKIQLDLPTIFKGVNRAVQDVPRFDLIIAILALDAEFQIVWVAALGKHVQRVGRISIVNYYGKVVYDVFAYYDEEPGTVIKLPPRRVKLGVYWEDIKPANGALHISEVEYYVDLVLYHSEVKCVVGHATANDVKVFSDFVFKGLNLRDTQMQEPYRAYARGSQRLPKLKVLAAVVLNWDIQGED